MTPEDKCKILAAKTAHAFSTYFESLEDFRNEAGLKDVINVYEILTSMTDKHGRICRQIKHVERNDAKPEYPAEVLESIAGYLIYAFMLLKHYNLQYEMGPSMIDELEKAIKQHSEKQ